MLRKLSKKLSKKISLVYKNILIFFSIRSYKKEYFENKQKNLFKEINLNRDYGLEIVKKLKNKFTFLNRSMSSEHEVVFASLSQNFKPNKILEIGTHDANNVFLLSQIFKDSSIVTIDLPSDHPDFRNFYGRKNNVQNFITERDNKLNNLDNVKFIEMNSLNLINHKENYDLIWVDGAHGYPVGSIDIINSIKILNSNGIILCDDIWKDNENKFERLYDSNAYFQTIEALEKEKILSVKFLYKRLDAKSNSLDKFRKYLAFIQNVKIH